jgi:hypothetical protein
MHTTGENNERRVNFAMQKYKQLNLPLCYQHISGGNPKIGPQKPLLLANNFPAAKDPFVRIEFELRSIFKDIKSSSIKTINGSKALEIRLSTGLFILVFAYQATQLLDDIEQAKQAKQERKNIAGFITTAFGSKFDLTALLQAKINATKQIDTVAANAQKVLNSSDYAEVRAFLNQLDTINSASGGAGYQGFSNTVNSLAGSTLGATNAQGFLDGFNKSLTQFDQWTKQASQALGNADQALARWQQSQLNLVRDFKNQIASFNKAYAAAKPERDALAAVAWFTNKLRDAGYYIKDTGTKAKIDGKPMIRFSTQTPPYYGQTELKEDQVFAVTYAEAATLATLPLAKLNQYYRKSENPHLQEFGPVKGEATTTSSNKPSNENPVLVNTTTAAQNTFGNVEELTYYFTSYIRGKLQGMEGYAVGGHTDFATYKNNYVQLLTVIGPQGRYVFAIPLSLIGNNISNLDAFFAQGLNTYLLPGHPSETIKLFDGQTQGVKIVEKPVKPTPLTGVDPDEKPGNFQTGQTPNYNQGVAGTTKPGNIPPDPNSGAHRPSAVYGTGSVDATAEGTSQTLIDSTSKLDWLLKAIGLDLAKDIAGIAVARRTFSMKDNKLNAAIALIYEKWFLALDKAAQTNSAFQTTLSFPLEHQATLLGVSIKQITKALTTSKKIRALVSVKNNTIIFTYNPNSAEKTSGSTIKPPSEKIKLNTPEAVDVVLIASGTSIKEFQLKFSSAKSFDEKSNVALELFKHLHKGLSELGKKNRAYREIDMPTFVILNKIFSVSNRNKFLSAGITGYNQTNKPQDVEGFIMAMSGRGSGYYYNYYESKTNIPYRPLPHK